MLSGPPGECYRAAIVHQSVAGPELVDFCGKARSANPGMVIIASMTRHDGALDFELLDRGVDDVVTDAHLPAAVFKRIAMRLAQRRWLEHTANTVQIGNVVVDFRNSRILRDGRHTTMTVREARVLEHLVRYAGNIVSRRDLRCSVWNDSAADPFSRTIDVYISRLRRLIEPDREDPIYLKTVHGHGYRLELPDSNARRHSA